MAGHHRPAKSGGSCSLGVVSKPGRPRSSDRAHPRNHQALRPRAPVPIRHRSRPVQSVKLARERPEPELVYALAELCWVEARRLDKWRKATALDYYVDAVAYAHDFLTDPGLVRAVGQRGSDPRYRSAMDL